jgi:hypothetical protein
MTTTTHTESVMNIHLAAFRKNMNPTDITIPYISCRRKDQLPVSSRGSALYLVDWFLNGHPSLRNHDDRRMTITDMANG